MAWQTLIPAITGIASSYIGGDQAKGAQEEADRRNRDALAILAGVDIPEMEDLLYQYDPSMMSQSVGKMEAIGEEAVEFDPSAMEDIDIDPRLRQEQLKAMGIYGEMADQGITEADLAAIEDARRASEASHQSRQQSILQEMQRRGQGGSGAEMAARLKSAQVSSEADAASGRDIAKQALERKIRGAELLAQQSGKVRSQDFGEQEKVAAARDALERFKNQNLQGVRSRNVGNQRNVQATNLAEKQRIADEQARLRQRQEERRVLATQEDYAYRYGQAKDQANVQKGIATERERDAKNRAQLGSDIGSTIGTGAVNYFGAQDKEKDRQSNERIAQY